jgi:DNA-binding XRE family transcriptional regulator
MIIKVLDGDNMKAGKLFEAALKEADITLKTGTALNIQVKGKGKYIQLVVSPPQLTDFETTILDRAKKAADKKAAYQPKLSVGETIRALRKAAGLTLAALAGKADMSKGSLCSLEKGERSAGLAVLKKLAAAMDIPVSVLVK